VVVVVVVVTVKSREQDVRYTRKCQPVSLEQYTKTVYQHSTPKTVHPNQYTQTSTPKTVHPKQSQQNTYRLHVRHGPPFFAGRVVRVVGWRGQYGVVVGNGNGSGTGDEIF
jgi:hypothetical protein